MNIYFIRLGYRVWFMWFNDVCFYCRSYNFIYELEYFSSFSLVLKFGEFLDFSF